MYWLVVATDVDITSPPPMVGRTSPPDVKVASILLPAPAPPTPISPDHCDPDGEPFPNASPDGDSRRGRRSDVKDGNGGSCSLNSYLLHSVSWLSLVKYQGVVSPLAMYQGVAPFADHFDTSFLFLWGQSPLACCVLRQKIQLWRTFRILSQSFFFSCLLIPPSCHPQPEGAP